MPLKSGFSEGSKTTGRVLLGMSESEDIPAGILVQIITAGSHDPTPQVEINGVYFSDGSYTKNLFPPGTYPIFWYNNGESNAVFNIWGSEGAISIDSPSSQSANLTITSENGVLTLYLYLCTGAGVQQFVNDHFQTGDFTGWTQSNLVIDNGSCVNGAWGTSIAPYIGSYDATQAGTNPCSLQQLLATPIPVACINIGSTFSITTVDLGAVCNPQTQKVRILYTDGTFTDVTLNAGGIYTWKTYDLRSFLTSGKVIKGIIYTVPGGYSSPPNCITHVGQVSLKI